MELVDERPVWSMSGAELVAGLDELQVLSTKVEARRLQLLAGLDASGYAKDVGARDTAHLISVRHRLDPADVRRDLKLATALPKYPAVQAALTDGFEIDEPAPGEDQTDPRDATGVDQADPRDAAGEDQADTQDATGVDLADAQVATGLDDAATVGDATSPVGTNAAGRLVLNAGQAQAIVSALEKVPASAMVPVEDLQVAEEEMVKAAAVLSPRDLRQLGSEIRNRLDTDGPAPDPDEALAREELWLKKADDGVKFGGYLAGENAELLETLVFAGAKPHKTPDGERDPRGRGKRQADALTAILHTAAAAGTAVPSHGGGTKPHITVTIDLKDLENSTGTGHLVHGNRLSAAAVRRLACDAGVIPLVLGSNSEPLDVGTEHRYVTHAIRQALNARDKGCIICGAPPAMTEAHHVVHWADGGPTSLDNLVLLCKREHIAVHQGHWTVEMVNGHPVVTRPPWAEPTPSHPPRRPHHPLEPPPPDTPPPQQHAA